MNEITIKRNEMMPACVMVYFRIHHCTPAGGHKIVPFISVQKSGWYYVYRTGMWQRFIILTFKKLRQQCYLIKSDHLYIPVSAP